MTVKTSISLTEAQARYARKLVEEGGYGSISAVLARGLDLLRRETELAEAETAALRALLQERRAGPFLSEPEGRATTAAMLKAKKAAHGL